MTCYKGIKNIFALTIITEIGDIKRFSHPRKLVSWIGMDIREYSSGGQHPNKVKVACAREMVGFVWESLHKAAA